MQAFGLHREKDFGGHVYQVTSRFRACPETDVLGTRQKRCINVN
jgi:hypothetical protein